MSPEIQRYLIPAQGREVEPIKKGFALLGELLNKEETPTEAILLVPGMRNVEGTTLETALGTNLSKALVKHRQVKVEGLGQLRLETQQTFGGLQVPAIVMAVYATKKMLDQIDSARAATAVIVVPRSMDDVDEWRRTWTPMIAGQAPAAPDKLIEDPVVEEALKALTKRINLGTGLLHPNDKKAAVQLLRLLQQKGYKFDADSMRAWAVRNGWTPEGADQLQDVADGILLRKRFRVGDSPAWSDDIIDQLQQRAKGTQAKRDA
jgi:hypothetical protein